MESGLILLALVLGFKHSFDADHLLAVANLLRKPRSLFSALKLGSSWAIGHMLTAGLITILLFFFKDSILVVLLPRFEVIVGIMLVALGVWALRDVFLLHAHEHTHSDDPHAHTHWHVHLKNSRTQPSADPHDHAHIFGIGILQGLASNDELLILLAGSLGLTSLGGVLVGVGVFSVGVVLGMILFCLAFSYPLIQTHQKTVYAALSVLVAISSIGYGIASLASA